MKRVILTGATGFVGANLARRLLRDGHELHLLVRSGYTAWRIDGIRHQVRLHEVELHDPAAVTRVVAEVRPEWVFHLAALSAYRAETDPCRAVQTDILGTVNLVEACLKIGFAALVSTGTSQEYGFKDHAPGESEWLEPHSRHGVTRAAATLFCRSTARSHQVHLSTLRLYSVFGPFEQPPRLMPTLIRLGLSGRLPPLVDPRTARDYVYVDDVVDAYLLAATRPGQEAGAVYNVGTGIQTSLREVVEVARRTMGITVEPRWGSQPERLWDTDVWVANTARIREQLGWQPRYSFEAGFQATVEWFRDNPELHQFYRQPDLEVR